jgi:hypothetical protein
VCVLPTLHGLLPGTVVWTSPFALSPWWCLSRACSRTWSRLVGRAWGPTSCTVSCVGATLRAREFVCDGPATARPAACILALPSPPHVPPPSVGVQYILVVVTPVQVFLLALTFVDGDVTKPLTIVPTGISCSTDGVGVVHVVRVVGTSRQGVYMMGWGGVGSVCVGGGGGRLWCLCLCVRRIATACSVVYESG